MTHDHHQRLQLPRALIDAVDDAERDRRLCSITKEIDLLTRHAQELVGAVVESSTRSTAIVQAISANIDIERKAEQAGKNLQRMKQSMLRVLQISARRRDLIDQHSIQQLQAAEPMDSKQLLLLLDRAARAATEIIDAADIDEDRRQKMLADIGRAFTAAAGVDE